MRYCPEILCHNGRVFSSWGSRCCREVSGSGRRLKITSTFQSKGTPLRSQFPTWTLIRRLSSSPASKQGKAGLSLVHSRIDWLRGLEDGRQLSVVPHAVIFIRPMNEEEKKKKVWELNTQSWLIHELFWVSSKYRACTAHCWYGNHTTEQQQNHHLPFSFHLLASCHLWTLFLPYFEHYKPLVLRFRQRWDLIWDSRTAV